MHVKFLSESVWISKCSKGENFKICLGKLECCLTVHLPLEIK